MARCHFCPPGPIHRTSVRKLPALERSHQHVLVHGKEKCASRALFSREMPIACVGSHWRKFRQFCRRGCMIPIWQFSSRVSRKLSNLREGGTCIIPAGRGYIKSACRMSKRYRRQIGRPTTVAWNVRFLFVSDCTFGTLRWSVLRGRPVYSNGKRCLIASPVGTGRSGGVCTWFVRTQMWEPTWFVRFGGTRCWLASSVGTRPSQPMVSAGAWFEAPPFRCRYTSHRGASSLSAIPRTKETVGARQHGWTTRAVASAEHDQIMLRKSSS